MEDISKIPRLPGDGAQEPDSSSDKASDKRQLEYCGLNSNTLQSKMADSAQSNIESK